jgi:hypothetical protein
MRIERLLGSDTRSREWASDTRYHLYATFVNFEHIFDTG